MERIPRVKETIATRVTSPDIREVLAVVAAIAFTVLAGVLQASLS